MALLNQRYQEYDNEAKQAVNKESQHGTVKGAMGSDDGVMIKERGGLRIAGQSKMPDSARVRLRSSRR